jgi:hypothetical protein
MILQKTQHLIEETCEAVPVTVEEIKLVLDQVCISARVK